MSIRVTIASATALMLLASCATYPGARNEDGNCVPLYGGKFETLPKAGYRFSDGGFIPMEQLIIMKDGGVWKCGD
jgi:hypothetical protein